MFKRQSRSLSPQRESLISLVSLSLLNTTGSSSVDIVTSSIRYEVVNLEVVVRFPAETNDTYLLQNVVPTPGPTVPPIE
jgi:hypothetical protein